MVKGRSLLQDPRKKKVLCLTLLILFAWVFFFFNLGSYSLKEPDEGRYAEIPREMVEQGEYIVPHLNYVRYFEKPPLLYWTTAASYRIFGVGEWPFRFPNALAALLCVLTTYFFASRRFGQETGILASVILMTSLEFFALARIVTIDMLFTFLLSAALFCFYEFFSEGRRFFLNLFFAALALAVLAKGPVAIVLMAGTIFIFLLLEKRLSFLKRMARPDGLLIFVAISAPWFIFISLKEPEFFSFFFIDQHILRFLTTKHNRSEPIYYFIPVLFGGLFPWSIFLPRAVARYWRAREMRLFLVWSLVVFVFFSVSGSKLMPYILPVFPALAVTLGGLLRNNWNVCVERKGEFVACLVVFACLASAGIAYRMGLFDGVLDRMTDLASLTGEVEALSVGWTIICCMLFVGFAFGLVRTYRLYFVAFSVFSLSVIIGLMLHAPVIDRVNTTKAIAETIKGIEQDEQMVFNFHAFDETLPFYLKERTYLVESVGELEMGAKYPDARSYFVKKDDFIRTFRSDKPVFVVLREKRLSQIKELAREDITLLFCEGKRCLAANHKAVESLKRR